jgi:predicted dehydrogenase
MTPEKLKVAVIGTGMIARAGHVPAWKNLSDRVEVVGVAGTDRERTDEFARTEGIPQAYTDWQKMLTRTKPDIVSVTTPNSYHREHTVAALEAGAHVWCEKPASTCHADAAEMFEVAQKKGRQVFICQTLRFANEVRAAKELVEAGRLGEIYYAEGFGMRRRGIPRWGRFHMKEHSGGGPVYDLGVHLLDRALWIMGFPKVQAVSSMTYTKFGNRDEGIATLVEDSGAPLGAHFPRPFDHRDFDVEDMAVGMIRFENKVVVNFKVSWAANAPDTWSTSLMGTEGGLELDPLRLTTQLDRYQADVALRVPPDRNVAFQGHWAAAEHFLRVLEGQEELLVKPSEVLTIMKILDAIYQSAEEGKEIAIST